jgi:hypothetical protein
VDPITDPKVECLYKPPLKVEVVLKLQMSNSQLGSSLKLQVLELKLLSFT